MQLIFGDRVHYYYKAGIIIKEACVVCEALKIELELEAYPASFDRIHAVQPIQCDQDDLKGTVDIEVREQLVFELLCQIGLFNCSN